MPTFGNMEVGDEFVHRLNGNMWGSISKAPEDGFAQSITVYVKNDGTPNRVRCSLYEEFLFGMGRNYFRFVMSTEEKIIPANFEGEVTFNFTAPPPIKKGTKYWINGWADEYASIFISTKKTPGVYQTAEWTSYMMEQAHGLSYPRFYEIIPQGVRGALICSIYCTYVFAVPLRFSCPYCGIEYSTFEEVVAHIKRTPSEMILLQICSTCGRTHYLKEELQLHKYEAHEIGSPPEQYSCIFCDFIRPTAKEIYTHINNTHPGPGPAEGGELPVSFEKAMSVTKQISLNFKWILGDTEPTTPDGYERAPTMDFDFGTLGKYWAFVKQSP